MSSVSVLEGRRQVLLATIALQRFALRSDIGSLRSSVAPRNLLKVPALLTCALQLLRVLHMLRKLRADRPRRA